MPKLSKPRTTAYTDTQHNANPRQPDAIDRQVARQLRLRRLELGLSQEKLAEHIGVSFQQIQKYERGDNRIGAGRLHQLASLLGVEVSYFFDSANAQPSTMPPQALQLAGAPNKEPFDFSAAFADRDFVELLLAYDKIRSPTKRKIVLQVARAFTEED